MESGPNLPQDSVQERFRNLHLARIVEQFCPESVWISPIAQADDDFQVLIVSPEFEGLFQGDRVAKVLLSCGLDGDLELFCYTPREMAKRVKSGSEMARLVKNGVRIV